MIFCKHEYHLYNVCIYIPPLRLSSYACFKFVCIKCGKVKTLYSLDIENNINNLKDYVRKQIVLGNQLEEYDKQCFFEMKTSDPGLINSYEGKYIDILKRKYKKRYNIDLNEITNWYK